MHTFKEAFGVEFGDHVQGVGVTCDLRTINPKMKGHGMFMEVFDSAMRPLNATHVGISPDGLEFDTADRYYERFVEYFAWSVNARVRLWKLKRKHGGGYFPFAGFARTIREKAIPKQRPLEDGDTFYMTFTDEHGDSATIKATFQRPKNKMARADISRKQTRAEVVYYCF